MLTPQFSFPFFLGNMSYVVLTRQEHDGETSLLLFADTKGVDLADTPPLMLLSDAVGDRLSARIAHAQNGESHDLAVTLLGELAGELSSDLPLGKVADLVLARATWIEAEGKARGGDVPPTP
jgi:hypothetical protein